MKAVQLVRVAREAGDADALVISEHPEPRPEAGQVRIRIAAAGVNPIDWKTAQGGGATPFIGDLPWIPGWECAGVVDAVGAGVEQWLRGERLMVLTNFPEPGRCYAEQVCVAADQCAEVPPFLSLVDAGGLPLAGLTAWQALFEQAQLKAGQSLLVLGAAGGVGHLGVQLAVAEGARVAGTARQDNHPWLKELGAETLLDYRHQPLAEAGPWEVILDAVGGETAIKALDVLAPGGVMVSLPSASIAEVQAAGEAQGKRVLGMRVHPDGGQLAKLAELMAEDRLVLAVEKRYKLQEVAQAHHHSASGHTKGKLLLTP